MAVEFTYWSVPYLVMSLITVSIAAVAWRNRGQTGAAGLLWDQLGLFCMASTLVGMLTVTDPDLKVLFWKLMWVAAVPTSLGWAHMALAYADSKHLVNRYTVSVAVGTGAVFIVSLFVSPMADMFLVDSELAGGTLRVEVGWLFWVWFSSFGVLFTIGIVELFRALRKQTAFAVQISMIVAGIAVTVLFHALYPLGLFPVEVGPLGSLVKTALFLTAIYWFGMLDVAPVAREKLVDNMDDPVMVINQNNRIVDVNAAAKRLVGVDEETLLVGESLSTTLGEHGDVLTEYARMADDAERSEGAETETILQEEISMRIDGTQRHYDLAISPVTSRGGENRGKLIVLREITELKRREAQLQERERDLEILNRILRHDIRNEMNVVVGYADAVESQVNGTAEDQLETIQNSAENVIDITDDVRELMQAMLEESDAELEPVAVADVLEAEVENSRASFAEAEITFENDLPQGTTVEATEMLSSVFTNLLNNAVAHNDKETPRVEVHAFEGGNPGSKVVVEVADNGPGIPPGKREEIFGRGEKGLESSGTGIGLYLVDTLVEQYDGTVQVHENGSTGAVFRLSLPTAVS